MNHILVFQNVYTTKHIINQKTIKLKWKKKIIIHLRFFFEDHNNPLTLVSLIFFLGGNHDFDELKQIRVNVIGILSNIYI